MSEHRKSISITGKLYDQLKAFAAKHNVAISTVVEQAVAPTLGHEPPIAYPPRRYRGPRKP
jgi:hypothetical protein